MGAIGFEVHATDGHSRAGLLTTPHGVVRTPALCPVAMQATVESLSSEELRATGSEAILANTYHLYLRPGADRVARLGGLHRFMGWDGPLVTDGGGWQLFSLGFAPERSVEHAPGPGFGREHRVGDALSLFPGEPSAPTRGQRPRITRFDADGVTFTSHIDGSTHRFTPEISIAVQEELGADVIFAFDESPSSRADERPAAQAIERAHAWARRCLDARTRADQGLLGIVQGGTSEALRRASAALIGALPFDGFAIGGSPGRSDDIRRILEWSIPLLPDEKPRHLAGISGPSDVFDAAERGVDTFDGVSPIRLARRGVLLAPTGPLSIASAPYRSDFTPIDADCDCYTCQTFTRAYVHHLFDAGELLAYRLATIHNLRFMLRLMSDIREAIEQRALASFRRDFESRWQASQLSF